MPYTTRYGLSENSLSSFHLPLQKYHLSTLTGFSRRWFEWLWPAAVYHSQPIFVLLSPLPLTRRQSRVSRPYYFYNVFSYMPFFLGSQKKLFFKGSVKDVFVSRTFSFFLWQENTAIWHWVPESNSGQCEAKFRQSVTSTCPTGWRDAKWKLVGVSDREPAGGWSTSLTSVPSGCGSSLLTLINSHLQEATSQDFIQQRETTRKVQEKLLMATEIAHADIYTNV